jgi:hypothetical protein
VNPQAAYRLRAMTIEIRRSVEATEHGSCLPAI